MALQLMVLCLLVAAALRLPDLVQTPPGIHYDEAANGILAADIGLRGERPIFIASYTGKEALFFYFAAGLIRLIGESVFSLRLTAAFIGLLTVAATYWLGYELFRDRRIGLLAAALLAVSFWHLLFSRLGFRAISQPLLQALVVAALFRGLRRDSWPWLAFAGLGLGLTAYTYLAARVFPIPLALALLPVLFNRRHAPRRWLQLGFFVVLAGLVLVPLLAYFLRHPEAFWVRINQVGPETGSFSALIESYGQSLGMLFIKGDPYWRFNIPDLPIFNWLWGVLMLAGWLFLVVRLFRRQEDWQRSAHLLVVLIPFFMILPTALAVGEIVPSNLRGLGLLPFLFFLPALGFWWLGTGLATIIRRYSPAIAKRSWFIKGATQLATDPALIFGLAFFLILALGARATARQYFIDWTDRTDLFYDSDADLVEVARYLDDHPHESETVFLTALHYRHPTLAFLSDQYDRVKWLPESQALVFPAESPAVYLFAHNSPLPAWAQPFLNERPEIEGPIGPDGEPTFTVYRGNQAASLAPQIALNANFDGWVTLLGYDLEEGVSGENLPVTLYWRVEKPAAAEIAPFIHLEDAWRYRWSQVEPNAYPAEQWTAGDLVVQRVDVPLPPGIPPGEYVLRVGFFEPDSGAQVPVIDESGRYAGNAYKIESVPIKAGPPPNVLPKPAHELDEEAGPGLRLIGYERAEERVTSGGSLWLSLWWEAFEPLAPSTSRLELIRPNNQGVILTDTQPVHGSYPFPEWSPPQFVIDHQTLRVPQSIAPGDYTLSLRLIDSARQTALLVDLGEVIVVPGERLFESPAAQFPLEAVLGDEITLLGYDLNPIGPRQAALKLIWQALAEPSTDYTVFFHVLNLDGSCCAWQQDAPPRQGIYPTSQWLKDEVIIDEYMIELPADLPPGNYPIEIGLYLPETGRRLAVTMPGLHPDDAVYLRPIVIE